MTAEMVAVTGIFLINISQNEKNGWEKIFYRQQRFTQKEKQAVKWSIFKLRKRILAAVTHRFFPSLLFLTSFFVVCNSFLPLYCNRHQTHNLSDNHFFVECCLLCSVCLLQAFIRLTRWDVTALFLFVLSHVQLLPLRLPIACYPIQAIIL